MTRQYQLLGLQEDARQLLERFFVPPARYGTAFHITPSFEDVREIQPSFSHVFESEQHILSQFQTLSSFQQENIQRTIALSRDPYFLWYMANMDQLPVEILRIQQGESKNRTFSGSRLLFVFLEEGARLEMTHSIQGEEVGIQYIYVWQEAGSIFSFWGVRHTNPFFHEHLDVHLIGSDANTSVRHFFGGVEREQLDVTVRAYHEAPKTESNLVVRAAGQDRSTTIYRGLIDMNKRAKGARGYQQGRALLLSPTAVVDMLPELAIKTNDVQCSHGVNTTHLDDAALFYMRSRGLSREQAEQLALTGFYYDRMDIPGSVASFLEPLIASL